MSPGDDRGRPQHGPASETTHAHHVDSDGTDLLCRLAQLVGKLNVRVARLEARVRHLEGQDRQPVGWLP